MFHAGDGNLHPLICYDESIAGQAEHAEAVAAEILQYCIDAGGAITGEHGVGADKKAYMPKMFGENDLDAMQRVRCAFDPAGLCKPGKVFPTPRLCGEVPGPYRQHRSNGPVRRALLMPTIALEPTDATRRRRCSPMLAGRPDGRPTRIRDKLADAHPLRATFTYPRHVSTRPFSTSPATGRNNSWRRDARERQRDSCAGRSMASVGPRLCRSATIGGIVATNDSGPRRHKHGSLRI